MVGEEMDFVNNLFNGRGYIEGITIVNVHGEILFTAKFNNKLESEDGNYEVVGKKFLDIYENLDENNSSVYMAMQRGVPIYTENQQIKCKNRPPIDITSLSIPIKSGRAIVGVIDLSVSGTSRQETDEENTVEIVKEVLEGYNKVDTLAHGKDQAVYTVKDIITCDEAMLNMRDNITKMGKTDLPVLIYGETGTGKELVAHSIHNASKRTAAPFVVQNCSSIPPNLMESILFGTSKGAFTGAMDNMGLLELADGGTLYLDEINSLSPELQPKLLRVLQNGTFRKVGDKEERRVNVRIVASSNEKPSEILANGKMRRDLYYRLSVLNIEIPPLRQRKDDIPILVNAFVSKYNELFNKRIRKVSCKLYDELKKYEWRGNVRELENTIAYGIGMVDEEAQILDFVDIADKLKSQNVLMDEIQENRTLMEMVAAYERKIIEESLNKSNRNISQAAVSLGVPRQTLSRKVNEYNLKE